MNIEALAREAGYGDALSSLHLPALERFAALIREAALTEKQEPVLWVNPNLDRVTTDRKLAEKNGLYIPLYTCPTCKQDLQVPEVKENT